MSDGVHKGSPVNYADIPVMVAADILELYNHDREDVHLHFKKDQAFLTVLRCKHCGYSFVPEPENEDWVCTHCQISYNLSTSLD